MFAKPKIKVMQNVKIEMKPYKEIFFFDSNRFKADIKLCKLLFLQITNLWV